MTLEDWAAFAEIIGGIAVVATLVYLAIQVKQNTGAIRTSNAMTVYLNFQNLARAPMMDRELGAIIIRAMGDKEELPPADKLAAYAWFFDMLKTGELAHMHYLCGELDKQYWHASLVFYRAYWQTPGFKAYWVERKRAFTPAFQSAVEEWMDDSSKAVTPADELFRASVTPASQKQRESN